MTKSKIFILIFIAFLTLILGIYFIFIYDAAHDDSSESVSDFSQDVVDGLNL